MLLLSSYESAGPQYPKITQQDRQLTYHVRIRHIPVTIVAVEKEKLLHILSVCLYPSLSSMQCEYCGPGSVVGIATGYGLDGQGIESRWGGCEIFRTCPDRTWGSPSLVYNGYRVFPGGKERPGREADPSPPSNAVVMKG